VCTSPNRLTIRLDFVMSTATLAVGRGGTRLHVGGLPPETAPQGPSVVRGIPIKQNALRGLRER